MAFYIILAALVAAALVLIFRDDHDRSYNREKDLLDCILDVHIHFFHVYFDHYLSMTKPR